MRTILPLALFVAAYVLFVAFPRRRAAVAAMAAVILVASGLLPWRTALTESISWNVLGLLTGMLILAEVFMHSRMPAVLAETLVDRSRTAWGAMVLLALLSSLLSMFLDNVTVVLLLGPVALSLAHKLKLSPVRPIICIAICSNLQGTATLIGDPPSMLLAGYLRLNFNDFFVYQGRAGIFWAVQVGALFAMGVVAFVLRKHKAPVVLIPVERPRSWVPTALLGALIPALSAGSFLDPGFRWLAGTVTVSFGLGAAFWYVRVARWGSLRKLLRELDWQTPVFLAGMFVMVGALNEAGWLHRAAGGIAGLVGHHLPLAFMSILVFAVLISAVIDNIPFLLAMIPVVQTMADGLDAPLPLLMFGLLIGACLGGNITPIGASANVVAIGILRRDGHDVSFSGFMRIGVPFTAAAVISAAVFVWWVWAA